MILAEFQQTRSRSVTVGQSQSGYRLQVIGYRLSVTGYRLQVTDYRLQVTGYRLSVTGYRLSVTGYRLQVTGYRLQVIKPWPKDQATRTTSFRNYTLSRKSWIHGRKG